MTRAFDNSSKRLMISPMELVYDVMNTPVYNFKGTVVGFGIYDKMDPRIEEISEWCFGEIKNRYHWYGGQFHNFAVDFYDRNDAMRFKLTWL